MIPTNEQLGTKQLAEQFADECCTSNTGILERHTIAWWVRHDCFKAGFTAAEERGREALELAEKLLEEIDSQHELGGPSFDGADPLREAISRVSGRGA